MIIIYLTYPIVYRIIWAMNINDRLNNMSKGELVSLIKEIKITCESNRFSKTVISANKTFNFILSLIKGEL